MVKLDHQGPHVKLRILVFISFLFVFLFFSLRHQGAIENPKKRDEVKEISSIFPK